MNYQCIIFFHVSMMLEALARLRRLFIDIYFVVDFLPRQLHPEH